MICAQIIQQNFRQWSVGRLVPLPFTFPAPEPLGTGEQGKPGLAGRSLCLAHLVPFHVLHQVVRAHEGAAARGADELPLPGVPPLVSGQLVASSKVLVARGHRAAERLFARVVALVCLEMGHLVVGLVTAVLGAGERLLSLLRTWVAGHQDE